MFLVVSDYVSENRDYWRTVKDYFRLITAKVSGRICLLSFAHALRASRFARGRSISAWMWRDGPFMGYCFGLRFMVFGFGLA